MELCCGVYLNPYAGSMSLGLDRNADSSPCRVFHTARFLQLVAKLASKVCF